MRPCLFVLSFTTVASLLAVHGASAQSSAPERKWEIEVRGGGMWTSNPVDGTTALPQPGPSLANPIGLGTASRVVPSWFVGDGAAQLNQAIASFRLGPSFTPLDPVLQSRFSERRSGANFGFRISGSFTPRLGAEFSFDYGRGMLALTGDSVSSLEATRASFVNAWNSFLSGPSRGTQAVTALATIAGDQGRQAVTTVTLLANLNTRGRATTYAALGAGVAANLGTPPSATLVGDYQFALVLPPGAPPPPVPLPAFHETDTVTVRTVLDNALVWVVGGGFKYVISKRWGFGSTLATT